MRFIRKTGVGGTERVIVVGLGPEIEELEPKTTFSGDFIIWWTSGKDEVWTCDKV